MKRIKAVTVKEFAHILRDPTSLAIVFLMPLLMIAIYGYALSFDLERVDAGIVDLCGGEHAADLVEKFANNRYFIVHRLDSQYPDPLAQGEKMLRAGKLKEILVIPRDFDQKLKEMRKAELGVIIDGSDSNVANLVYQYNERIVMDFVSRFRDFEKFFKIHTKIHFNPELKSSFFFIPGLIAILLIMISALLTSLSISREKESGSIELVFISPLKSPEIIVGKTLPYIVVALLVGAVILFFSRFWFDVPFRGSLAVLSVFALLYIFAGLSFGILISTVAPNQKVAMFATLLATLLPSIMLSGFIFPLESLPTALQVISHVVPATYFLRIIRGVVLKGAEIHHFMVEGLAMVAFSAVLLLVAMIKFDRNRKKSR